MSLIRGENVIIYVYDDGQWKPIICGKSCSLTTVAETIETSITGSGQWRTYEYAGFTWTVSMDGATFLDGENQLSLQDIRLMQYGKEKLLIRYQRTDESSNVYLEQGTVLITNVSDTGAMDDMNLFTIELQGSGPLTISATPTPINPTAKVKRFEYTADGTSDSFTSATLIGKDVIEVVADGIGRCKIITSGSPVGQEALYDSATGTVTFPMILEDDVEVYVLYQDI
jgi:predicted secreted protein